MLNSYKEHICSICKNKCDKAFVIIEEADCITIKCENALIDKEKLQGYIPPLITRARQHTKQIGGKII